MSSSSIRTATSERPTPGVDRATRIETDGVLVRPINGQIYLIEERDLEWLSSDETQPPLSRLISRH